jgi:hypothetical protein
MLASLAAIVDFPYSCPDSLSSADAYARKKVLGHDGKQDAHAIAHCVQVTDTMNPRMLVTCDLLDDQPGPGNAHSDQRLYFESVAPEPAAAVDPADRFCGEAQHRDVTAPEGIEPVTQI